MKERTSITVQTTVHKPVEKVWELWTSPQHIMRWNHASDDWHTPRAENDLRAGGRFVYRMEAKDGSFGFDFEGVYDEVKTDERIVYKIGDGRKVTITFTGNNAGTHVAEIFEAESMNSIDMQRSGWQAILDNFKEYAEAESNDQDS
jgi:uncharacterized protein YndB with AHSA1/START domain